MMWTEKELKDDSVGFNRSTPVADCCGTGPSSLPLRGGPGLLSQKAQLLLPSRGETLNALSTKMDETEKRTLCGVRYPGLASDTTCVRYPGHSGSHVNKHNVMWESNDNHSLGASLREHYALSAQDRATQEWLDVKYGRRD
jgi:hypothetical protein